MRKMRLMQRSRKSASVAAAPIAAAPAAGEADMRKLQRAIHPPQYPKHEQLRLVAAFDRRGRRRHRSPAHDWEDATRTTVLSSYGCGLGWQRDRGILDWNLTPVERWPENVIEDYLTHLNENEYAQATVYS